VTVQATPVATPPGWAGASINEGPCCSGSVLFRPGRPEITLRGSGADLWGAADGCYFLNLPVAGDFQITARLAAGPIATRWDAKAGLMLRESLAAGAHEACLVATPAAGLQFQWRGETSLTSPAEYPNGSLILLDASALRPMSRAAAGSGLWLRLTRQGATVRAQYSRDGGTTFYPPAPARLRFKPGLPDTVLAGLAITARDEDQIAEAKFRDLRIEPLGR
jgi:hypothetical protein